MKHSFLRDNVRWMVAHSEKNIIDLEESSFYNLHSSYDFYDNYELKKEGL